MARSRLFAAADRAELIGNALTDPHDIAIASQYAQELRKLASWEVIDECAPSGREHRRDTDRDRLGGMLKKVFRPKPAQTFTDALQALDQDD